MGSAVAVWRLISKEKEIKKLAWQTDDHKEMEVHAFTRSIYDQLSNCIMHDCRDQLASNALICALLLPEHFRM